MRCALTRRAATSCDGRFRLHEVRAWRAAGGAKPLPPIDGSLRPPRLDIAGAELHGIEIEMDSGRGD